MALIYSKLATLTTTDRQYSYHSWRSHGTSAPKIIAVKSVIWPYHRVSSVGKLSIQFDANRCVSLWRGFHTLTVESTVRSCLTMSSSEWEKCYWGYHSMRSCCERAAWRPLCEADVFQRPPLSVASSTSQTKKNGKGKRYRETEGQKDQQSSGFLLVAISNHQLLADHTTLVPPLLPQQPPLQFSSHTFYFGTYEVLSRTFFVTRPRDWRCLPFFLSPQGRQIETDLTLFHGHHHALSVGSSQENFLTISKEF